MEKGGKASFFNFVLIAATFFILLTGPLISSTIIHLLMQVFGLLLIFWAVLVRRVTKSVKHISLPSGYFFATSGPYEIIRHPIYVGYLLIVLSLVEAEFTFLRIIALLLIVTMILLKIIREETTMKREVKEYQNYKEQTKAAIPYLL